jgi:hypothetical protein
MHFVKQATWDAEPIAAFGVPAYSRVAHVDHLVQQVVDSRRRVLSLANISSIG